MKRNYLLGLVLSGLFVVGSGGSVRAGLFTGSFDPANWELGAASSNPGTYVFTGPGGPYTLQITGAGAGLSDTAVVLKSPYCSAPTLLYFTWSVVKNGNLGAPEVSYLVNGTPTALVGTSGTVSDLSLPAGMEFGFMLGANPESGKNPAVFAVTDWEAQVVPEPSTWLTGTLVLGVVLFEVVRRQRRGAVVPA